MNAEERRQAVARHIRNAGGPVSASALAGRFGVSRQVIVGDVALLRAGGETIEATPRGYVAAVPAGAVTRTVACIHSREDMEAELTAVVDQGAEVTDVAVEHPVYGQLIGSLRVRSRYDVAQFMAQVEGSEPLSRLTGGVHLHTLTAPDSETLDRAVAALKAGGFLYE